MFASIIMMYNYLAIHSVLKTHRELWIIYRHTLHQELNRRSPRKYPSATSLDISESASILMEKSRKSSLGPVYIQYSNNVNSGMSEQEATAIMTQSKAWKDFEAKMKRVDEQTGISFAKESGPSIDHAHKIREKEYEAMDDMALYGALSRESSLGLLLFSCEYEVMESFTHAHLKR